MPERRRARYRHRGFKDAVLDHQNPGKTRSGDNSNYEKGYQDGLRAVKRIVTLTRDESGSSDESRRP